MSYMRKNMRAYKISIVCGVTPLLVGTSVFVLWLITQWTILEEIGIFTIIGGIVLFSIGAIALVLHTLGRNKTSEVRSSLCRENTRAAGILLLNFPVALLIVFLVSHIQSYYTIIVKNDSSYQIDNFVINSTGNIILVGIIPSRQSVKKKFKVGEGRITFKASINGKVFEDTIEGYVSGSGDKKVVTIRQDQSYSIQKY